VLCCCKSCQSLQFYTFLCWSCRDCGFTYDLYFLSFCQFLRKRPLTNVLLYTFCSASVTTAIFFKSNSENYFSYQFTSLWRTVWMVLFYIFKSLKENPLNVLLFIYPSVMFQHEVSSETGHCHWLLLWLVWCTHLLTHHRCYYTGGKHLTQFWTYYISVWVGWSLLKCYLLSFLFATVRSVYLTIESYHRKVAFIVPG